MKTIAEWNAEKKAAYVPPNYDFTPAKPEPIGAACECGGRLMTRPGWIWGIGPHYSCIICEKCQREGYIKNWMCPEEIIMTNHFNQLGHEQSK